MRQLLLLVVALTSTLVLAPSAAVADSATHTYMLEMEGPNFGSAPNGDMVTITGHVDFSVNPKSAEQHRSRPRRGRDARRPGCHQLQPHGRWGQRHHPDELTDEEAAAHTGGRGARVCPGGGCGRAERRERGRPRHGRRDNAVLAVRIRSDQGRRRFRPGLVQLPHGGRLPVPRLYADGRARSGHERGHRERRGELRRRRDVPDRQPGEVAGDVSCRGDGGRAGAGNPSADASHTVAVPPADRARARRADQHPLSATTEGIFLARPERPGEGIPLAVKDLFDTAGLTTTYGSAIFADHVPPTTAEAVLRLEAAGYVNVGKTNLHEFAYGITSENPHFGTVPNPIAPGRIAGGSSGGSAAALAAGLADAALGTDSGGSIRIPAACCGVVGFKPTFGLVPTEGCFPLAPSYDHVGPMARTVADCEAAMVPLAPGFAPVSLSSLEDLAVGLAVHEEVDTLVRARVEEAAARFPQPRSLDLVYPLETEPLFMHE